MTTKQREFYIALKRNTNPVESPSHGQHCKCPACFEEWACATSFETMNPEGRKRAAEREGSDEPKR